MNYLEQVSLWWDFNFSQLCEKVEKLCPVSVPDMDSQVIFLFSDLKVNFFLILKNKLKKLLPKFI